ncbi:MULTISPECIES: MarR family winged helix-turn-helix transcriptional regulator [unclassified Blastococcus]
MAEAAPPGPGQTLFRFVRYWSRRWTATDGGDGADAGRGGGGGDGGDAGRGAGAGGEPSRERGRDVMVVEAVSARAPAPASVRDVAEQLGLDHSGASRLVAGAVDRGLLAAAADPGDRRRRRVLVTPAGARLLADAHRWQEEVFGRLTADWSSDEVAQFHRLMSRLIGGPG